MRRWKLGPPYGSNPQYPRMVPFTSGSSFAGSSECVLITNPPLAASATAGNSIASPDFVVTRSTKSCAISVEKTSGAPSTGRISGDFCKQKTASALTARSGGNWGAWMGGQPTPSTDFGLWKEGGLFSFKLSVIPVGNASAGMY